MCDDATKSVRSHREKSLLLKKKSRVLPVIINPIGC